MTAPESTSPSALALLAGKVVMVTGAGNGLGRAIAIQSARAGASVVATAPHDNIEDTAAMIRADGGEVTVARVDVTVAAQVVAGVEVARSTYGGLDAMVHNATSAESSQIGTLESVGGASWDDHMAVSVRGAYLCAHAAYPELVKRGGKLVMFTSPAAMEGAKMLPAYAVVKGALRAMVKALAVEWGPSGVGVVAISPLAVTPALGKAYLADPDLEPRMAAVSPFGRVGDPVDDVAPPIVFLMSDGAHYLSGQTIIIDGARYTGL